MELLHALARLALTGFAALGITVAPMGLGSDIPNTPALVDAYLASGIAKTDTSMTLSTGTTRDGVSLSGYTCFVIDANLPTAEFVCGTAAGTSVTGMVRGVKLSDPTATSSDLAYSHRRFASVTVSDYPTIQRLSRALNGTDSIDNVLSYTDSDPADFTSSQDIPSRGYVDALSFGAIPAASETASGFVELATGAEAAASTQSGSEARLALPASVATSTYNAATAANVVPVTDGTGKIDDDFLPATIGGAHTYSGASTFPSTFEAAATSSASIGDFPAWEIGKQMQVISTTGTSTFTVPSGITKVAVEVQAGGGAGNTCGGGGGGYAFKNVDVSATTTIQVYVAPSAAATTNGNPSKFGTNGYYFYATGGSVGGNGSSCNGGDGGTGVNGDLNLSGDGGGPYGLTNTTPHSFYGNGGSSHLGGGAASVYEGKSGKAGGNYGGGGGGSSTTAGAGAQGVIVIRW